MSKQIETPATEEQGSQFGSAGSHDQGEASLPPFPPRPEMEKGHANGWDVASQYRAIQEAQRLHEETIKQLREEVQYQKERLSELSESSASQGRIPQLDAVFLRLSELERKIGQDAPDPLLNEIVHRLAALENTPNQKQGGKDSRVDELVEQVDKLRRRASEPTADTRVDDVVLRIASLESANKRGNYALEIEGLSNRLQDARAELEEARRADLNVFQQELQTLTERVRELSESGDSDARIEAVETRLEEFSQSSAESRAALETKLDDLAEKIPAPIDPEQEQARWQTLESRLETLEQKPDPADVEQEQARWQALEARLETLEQTPAPVSPEAVEDLEKSVSGLREQIDAVRERTADIPAPQRLLDLDARLDQLAGRLAEVDGRFEELAEKARNPEPDPETAALRERVTALEDRSAAVQEISGRLGVLEQASEEPAKIPEEWADKVERMTARLDGLEDLADRVAKVEKNGEESSQAGLLDLTSRMRALEITSEDLGDVHSLVARLREEIAELRQGGSVGELRTELEALREQSAKDESEELRTRIGGLETRLSDIESVSRIEGASPRLDALEDKLRDLDDLSEVRRRLTVLEMSSREEGSARSEEIAARLEALEARPVAEAGDDSARAEMEERLAAIQARVAELETRPASAEGVEASDESWRSALAALEERLGLVENSSGGPVVDVEMLSARIADLEGRLAQLPVADDGAAEARVRLDSLGAELELLKQSAAATADSAGAVADPRINEVMDRLDWIERSTSGATVDLDPLRLRIEALEERPVGEDDSDAGVRTRMQEVLDRLDLLESQGAIEGGVALQKESERWSQWARSTLEEIGELRRQVEEVQKAPAASSGSGAAGLDAEAVEALGLTISSGLAKGEMRSLRQQMYFIYFAIGTLLALAVVFLFMNLTN